ncbi:MAG: ABC transporter ATP-binding protein [Acidobacteria bacterium]|nr:ABC transporter ATP-binding protein [Acidobacteriota bacterium]
MNEAISVHHLSKWYKHRVAVDDVSFEVPFGTVTGFLGPNGAGKSTTMRMLVGLVRPSSGEILIGGQTPSDIPTLGRRLGGVFEQSGFYGGCTAQEVLQIAALSMGVHGARVSNVLEQVGLRSVADRNARRLSQGMRQRLQLAIAMLGDPDILLLDEPINGLDAATIEWFREFMRNAAESGKAVLVSSHVLAEMEQTIDRAIVISQGQIRADLTLSELKQLGAEVRVISSDSPLLGKTALEAGADVTFGLGSSQEVLIRGVSTEQIQNWASGNGITITNLLFNVGSLERAYFSLVGRDLEAQAGSVR